jgi:hypothetical protein
MLIGETILFCLLARAIMALTEATKDNFQKFVYFPLFALVGLFLSCFTLLKLGISTPYYFFSRLGAGSMEINDKYFPFGDLAHLTSAAICQDPVIIGLVACDPWAREFNQNPAIVHFLNLVNLTNLTVLGLSIFLVFILILSFFVYRFEANALTLTIFLFSPVVALAVDRGNELLTIAFILGASLCLRSDRKLLKSAGVVILFLSCVFKLWPIVFLIFYFIYNRKELKFPVNTLFLAPLIYWTINFGQIQPMLKSTELGSPYGVSFGFKLFFSTSLNTKNAIYLASLAFAIYLVFYLLTRESFTQFKNSYQGNATMILIAPFFLTFVAIWLVSDSFSYRMIILLPILIILGKSWNQGGNWSQSLSVFILLVVLTSRLAITSAASSALAMYFLHASIAFSYRRVHSLKKYRLI